MKYWFWRYLYDYKAHKKSLLRLTQRLNESISERKRIEEEFIALYSSKDIDKDSLVRINSLLDDLRFTNPNNPLSDIAIYEDLIKDSIREILFYYDSITLDCYALRYENLDRY